MTLSIEARTANGTLACALLVAASTSVALFAVGCSSLVTVDDYTFDVDPCGPRPPACTGGRELVFVLQSTDFARVDAAGHRDGFDLDGTDAPICGQADFVSAEGRSAIDNQMGQLFELYEDLTGLNLRTASETSAVAGEGLQLIVVSHVDDLASDDCVEVSQHIAMLPEGVTPADLDTDGDGLLDPGLTLDYAAGGSRDDTACAIAGVVHARFTSTLTLFPDTDLEGTVDRGRLRMPVTSSGSRGAVLGGSIRLADLANLPPAIVEFIRPRADLDPSSRTSSDCSSISFAIVLDMVPATLGLVRDP